MPSETTMPERIYVTAQHIKIEYLDEQFDHETEYILATAHDAKVRELEALILLADNHLEPNWNSAADVEAANRIGVAATQIRQGTHPR